MPVRLADLPGPLVEALVVHEALRRLGFPSEAIFLRPQPAPGDLQVVLLAQGRQYAVGVGRFRPERAVRLWPDAVAAWNGAPEAELQAIWERSTIRARGFELVAGLQAEGFQLGPAAASWARA